MSYGWVGGWVRSRWLEYALLESRGLGGWVDGGGGGGRGGGGWSGWVGGWVGDTYLALHVQPVGGGEAADGLQGLLWVGGWVGGWMNS